MNFVYKSIFAIAFFCQLQLMGQTEPLQFSAPLKIGKNINSSAEESFPIITQDGKTMYYARTFHPQNKGGTTAGQDIWHSDLNADNFAATKNLGELNNTGSNVVAGIARDGKRLYLLNQFVDKNTTKPGITYSDYGSNAWQEPVSVMIPELDIEEVFYSAYVSPQEDFILWSIPAKEGTGNDLFVSLSADNGGTWTQPITLGSGINSAADEISPFYDPSRSMLFYSANSGSDPDNYDIYYAKKLDDNWTSWSAPLAMGGGINSPGFDAYFFLEPAGKAYFCSNRGDSLSSVYLSEVVEQITEVPDTVQEVEIVEAVVETRMPDPVLIIETTKGGKTTERMLESLTREELLDETTRIRFVYFDYDKYNIGAKYIEVLDDAAAILDKHQEMHLEIIGHTDSIASDAYNNVLSDNRAYSAKEFLVINGVEPMRIATKGLGEKEPYASNETEEGRALNRRVELFFREW